VSRRRAPRPAATAFQAALQKAAPQTPLATIQAAWTRAVGERLAAVATPVSERAGTLTIECTDTVWAQELDLMQETLLERLRAEVGDQAPQALRFRVDSARF
jgi:predicted nucleic acid-binding Zn ribbon protein